MASNRFSASFSRGSVFQCTCCKRNTRMTTQANEDFCGDCEELLMIQNGLWDNGEADFRSWNGPKERDRLLNKIIKLKGNETAVRAYMPDLFKVAA